MSYIDEEMPIIESTRISKAKTIRIIEGSSKSCTLCIRYDSGIEGVLYRADPECNHEIQAQWSGIKCIKCGGWYCA